MGLPPTSPRFKFVHLMHPAAASSSQAVPRRPPRQPPSPSTRSRSLELLDQQEDQEQKSTISPTIVHRPPLPRPRSRSLDVLLDDDVKKNGDEETCGQQNRQKEYEKNLECLSTNSEENKTVSTLEESQMKFNTKAVEFKNETGSIPQAKIELKSEMKDARTDKGNQNVLPTRPPKPSRCSSSEGQFSTNKQCEGRKRQIEEKKIKEVMQVSLVKQSDNDDYDDDDDDRSSTLLKTSRSCGAGLDSDGSITSNEYGARPCAKGQGSLLSLPAGVEPKRKRNFMDKCVNKVRSFMKK